MTRFLNVRSCARFARRAISDRSGGGACGRQRADLALPRRFYSARGRALLWAPDLRVASTFAAAQASADWATLVGDDTIFEWRSCARFAPLPGSDRGSGAACGFSETVLPACGRASLPACFRLIQCGVDHTTSRRQENDMKRIRRRQEKDIAVTARRYGGDRFCACPAGKGFRAGSESLCLNQIG